MGHQPAILGSGKDLGCTRLTLRDCGLLTILKEHFSVQASTGYGFHPARVKTGGGMAPNY